MIPVADMMRGITMTQAQCAALPQAVWVNVMGRDFCMRYYLSTAGGEGTRPVGLPPGRPARKAQSQDRRVHARAADDKDLDTDEFVRARGSSVQADQGPPAIYLARVGLDGSSGDHRIRHTVLELECHQCGARRDQEAPRLRRLPPDRPIRRLEAGRRHAGAARRYRLRGDRLRPARRANARRAARPIPAPNISTSRTRFR